MVQTNNVWLVKVRDTTNGYIEGVPVVGDVIRTFNVVESTEMSEYDFETYLIKKFGGPRIVSFERVK